MSNIEQALASKEILGVLSGNRVEEGEGMSIARYFPSPEADGVDPFVLLDHFGSGEYPPGEAKGIPAHPHAGFEIVTYILHGGLEHEDSLGNKVQAEPGGLMWMTCGAGLQHSENPTKALLEKGGRLEGFQLWINLPRAKKQLAPRVGFVSPQNVPEATSADGRVHLRVISGEALGASARLGLDSELLYLHVKLDAEARYEHVLAPGSTGFVVAMDDGLLVGEHMLAAGDMAVLGPEGDRVLITAPAGGQAILIAGKPLHEPVVRYGPFVMSSAEELHEAIDAYRSGKMGRL